MNMLICVYGRICGVKKTTFTRLGAVDPVYQSQDAGPGLAIQDCWESLPARQAPG